MGITIKIDGHMVSVEVSAEVGEFLERGKRDNRKLDRERQRYWDCREYSEYIIAMEGRLPYCETPEQCVCHMKTREEIFTILSRCTGIQRERFLLHALYDLSYAEIGALCGCSKSAVRDSILAVRKIFQKFFKNRPHDCPP